VAGCARAQVWWSSGSPLLGRLRVHDLASGATAEVVKARAMPAVTALALSGAAGRVWTGHAGGYMRVWGEASRNPICPLLRAFHSDVRRAPAERRGAALPGGGTGFGRRVADRRGGACPAGAARPDAAALARERAAGGAAALLPAALLATQVQGCSATRRAGHHSARARHGSLPRGPGMTQGALRACATRRETHP